MAHNTFTRFVTSDNDLPGLVAYSLYKKEKIAWVAHKIASSPTGKAPSAREIEEHFIKMIRDEHIAQHKANANVLLNNFADTMLAAELEQEREAIWEDALIKSVNPPWYKRLRDDTFANLASSAVITAGVVIFWLVSAAPSNFVSSAIAGALSGQVPKAEASEPVKEARKDQ